MKAPRFNGVVGLDLSLSETGLAYTPLGNDDPGSYIFATKPTEQDYDGVIRLRSIVSWVRSHSCTDADYPLFVMEDFSFASKGRAVFQTGGLQYLVRSMLVKEKQRYVLVAPQALKKFVTGKGNGDKSVVIKRLYTNFGIDEDNDNAADAIGLALIGQALLGYRPVKRKHEQEVVQLLKTKYAGILGDDGGEKVRSNQKDRVRRRASRS